MPTVDIIGVTAVDLKMSRVQAAAHLFEELDRVLIRMPAGDNPDFAVVERFTGDDLKKWDAETIEKETFFIAGQPSQLTAKVFASHHAIVMAYKNSSVYWQDGAVTELATYLAETGLVN